LLRADWLHLPVAVIWQTATFLLPMLAVLRMWAPFAGVLAVWLVLTARLSLEIWRAERSALASPEPEKVRK